MDWTKTVLSRIAGTVESGKAKCSTPKLQIHEWDNLNLILKQKTEEVNQITDDNFFQGGKVKTRIDL